MRALAGAPLALRFEALSFRYPAAERWALERITLRIEPGELVVLAGRSGSGKTTLLRAACGLVPHLDGGEFGGRAVIGGLDSREHGPGDLAAVVAYLAQDPEAQVVSTTVRAEIGLAPALRGAASQAQARAVEEAALALGVAHLLERTTDSLSGGELQRVALAAALTGRPSLVLLDEPTSQLDPVAAEELISLLRRLNEQWGLTVVLCEHRLDRCLDAADRVIALAAGALAFDGSPAAYLGWALDHDEESATPLARVCRAAEISAPLPVGVRQARARLRPLLECAPSGAPAEAPMPPAVRRRRSRPADPVALRAAKLWVRHDDEIGRPEALRGLELEVRGGERVALMGRNGAGKSTLLRALAGLAAPWRGIAEAPGGIALLGQNPSDYLVRDRVGEELPGESGARALAAVGLSAAVDRDPRDLSGGERQRLALAIVLAGRGEAGAAMPGLVALDEPTRGMDGGRKRELHRLLGRFGEAGAALLVATHDVEFAAEFADRVVLMAEGRVIADGGVETILSGGWYFSTQVGRVFGDGIATVEAARKLLAARRSLHTNSVEVPR